MKNKIAATFAMLAITFAVSAQKLLYTLKPGEKILMEDEHRLLAYNRAFFHLMFTERGAYKYVIFNGKEFGPFIDIWSSESAPSLLDWGVTGKDSLYYELILDKGLQLGPYEGMSDVFRNDNPADPANDKSHYGFRIRKGDQHYIIVDGKEFGPFPELDLGTPEFSTDGTNWATTYWDDEKKKYTVFTPKGSFQTEGQPHGIAFVNNELRANMHVNKGSFVCECDGFKIYYLDGSSSSVGCGSKIFTSQSYSPFELFDVQGNVVETGMEMYPMSRGSNIVVTYAKYVGMTDGKEVPIVNNGSKYPDLWTMGCTYTDIPVVKQLQKKYYVKVNDQVLGPYSNMSLYSANIGYAPGKSAFIAQPGGVLVVDGKLTATKGVSSLNYNPLTGSMLCEMESGETTYNGKPVGKFENAQTNFDLESDQFTIAHEKDGKSYLYVSTAKKSIGPFEETPAIIFSTDKLHWGYIQQRKVYIDGVVKAQQGFDLVYDPVAKAFKWISLAGKNVMLNELKM